MQEAFLTEAINWSEKEYGKRENGRVEERSSKISILKV
jgi:hypothetical protein